MPTDTAALADLLTAPTPDRPLTADERTALLAALSELVAAQSTIAKQGMLLASYDEDTQAIERAARAAVRHATDSLAHAPPGAADPAEAAAARRALLEAANGSATLAAIATAALTFALRVGGLAR